MGDMKIGVIGHSTRISIFDENDSLPTDQKIEILQPPKIPPKPHMNRKARRAEKDRIRRMKKKPSTHTTVPLVDFGKRTANDNIYSSICFSERDIQRPEPSPPSEYDPFISRLPLIYRSQHHILGGGNVL